MRKSLRRGFSSAELMVVVAIVAIVGFFFIQSFMSSQNLMSAGEMGTIMDRYQMESVTKAQSSDGLKAVRDWITTNRPDIKLCLERNGSGCDALHNVRIAFNGGIKELQSRGFDKTGSLCVGASCAASTTLWLNPDCEAVDICNGVRLQVETRTTNNSAVPAARLLSLYFTSLKLVPTVGFDFSCATGGKMIVGFDLANRKAICATGSIIDCKGGIPSEISGMGMVSGSSACRPVLNFSSRNKDGLGSDTTLFNPGYKSVGISRPIVPANTNEALAQDECGVTILRKVTLRVGESYNGVGVCPGGSQKVLYRPGNQTNFDPNDALTGYSRPYDANPTNAAWGRATGKEWNVRFARPTYGYSYINWHLTDRCCRDRSDVWTLEQIATKFREETTIDAATQATLMREQIAIMDTDQATSKFILVDPARNVLLTKTVNTTQVFSQKVSLPVIEVPYAEAVPASTPLGTVSVTTDGTHILVTQVKIAEFPNRENTVTYNYDVFSNTIGNAIYSASANPRIVVNYTNQNGSVLKTESRNPANSSQQSLTRLQTRYVSVELAEVADASTPIGTESVQSGSENLITKTVIIPAMEGADPGSAPREVRNINIKDASGNILRTVSLNTAPGDKIRIRYRVDFDWTLGDTNDQPMNYEIKNKEGTILKTVLVNPGQRVKITYKKAFHVVDR